MILLIHDLCFNYFQKAFEIAVTGNMDILTLLNGLRRLPQLVPFWVKVFVINWKFI